MYDKGRNPIPAIALTPAWLGALLVMACLGSAPHVILSAPPQASLESVTDRVTYNAGDQVRLRIIFPSPEAEQTRARYLFAVRYEGEEKPVADGLALGNPAGSPQGYRLLWKVPPEARAGRYEIDVRGQSPASQQDITRLCSFVVHRQVMQIVSAEVAQPYYTSGDAIGCSVKMENLSAQTLPGLPLVQDASLG